MQYEIRSLDPVKDEAMFKQAYEWIFAKPHWLQYTDGVMSIAGNVYSFDNYLKQAKEPTEYNVGVFDGSGNLTALFTIQDRKDGSFQVHVNADRGVDRQALIAGATRLRDWLLANGAREIFGLIADVNRPLRRFAEEAGFTYCGVRIYKGSLNGRRPIAWLRYATAR